MRGIWWNLAPAPCPITRGRPQYKPDAQAREDRLGIPVAIADDARKSSLACASGLYWGRLEHEASTSTWRADAIPHQVPNLSQIAYPVAGLGKGRPIADYARLVGPCVLTLVETTERRKPDACSYLFFRRSARIPSRLVACRILGPDHDPRPRHPPPPWSTLHRVQVAMPKEFTTLAAGSRAIHLVQLSFFASIPPRTSARLEWGTKVNALRKGTLRHGRGSSTTRRGQAVDRSGPTDGHGGAWAFRARGRRLHAVVLS